MAKPAFVTLAEGLVGPAEVIEQYFENLGHKVVREPSVLAYPYTPTLRCKRERTTIIVEVDAAIRSERVREWIRFASSVNSDVRVAIAVPSSATRDVATEDLLRAEKAGVYLVGKEVTEICVPHDLSLNMALPELAQLSPKVRTVLGPMYEQYEHSHWREAFETGCQAFETECRRYLKAGIASGRVVVLDKIGRPRRMHDTTVDKMTLGGLAKAFAAIQTPNYADTVLASVLSQINPNRIGVAHHRTTPATEARLRKKVGSDVWLFIKGLRQIYPDRPKRRRRKA